MDDLSSFLSDVRRYAQLLASLIAAPPPFAPEAEAASALQVERGVIFPLLLSDPLSTELTRVHRMIELSRLDRLAHIAIVDRTGHHRPIYRPLLVYAWLAAFRLVYESLPRPDFGRWEEALRVYCDLLESEMGEIQWDHDAFSASHGASASELAWIALALFVAGKVFVRDVWIDLASDFFGRLTAAQQPNGAFLSTRPSDNPETHAYHELAILHAAASYAVQSEDRTLATAVARNAEFHLHQTQPDHATSLPLGVFAFIWNQSTRSLADQLLHTVRTMQPGGPDGVSLILLGDALHCLRLFGA